jgi:hypothetical protein
LTSWCTGWRRVDGGPDPSRTDSDLALVEVDVSAGGLNNRAVVRAPKLDRPAASM